MPTTLKTWLRAGFLAVVLLAVVAVPQRLGNVSPAPSPPFSSPNPPVPLEELTSLAKKWGVSQVDMWEILYYAELYSDKTFPSKSDILAVIQVESGFKAKAKHEGDGSVGLMQISPLHQIPHLTQVEVNIRAGATLLKKYLGLFGGDSAKALVAYNAGPARVDDICEGLDPCSTEYVAKVLKAKTSWRKL
jgi:hypothetical protein